MTTTTTSCSSSSSTSSLLLTSGASGRVNAIFSLRALKGLIMLINAFLLLLLVPFRVKKRSNCTSTSSSSSSSSCSSSSSSSMAMMDDYQKQKEREGGGGEGGHRKTTTTTKVLRVSYHRKTTTTKVTEDRDVMIRRSIAIRRVNEEETPLDDGEESSVRDVSMFVTSRGDTLFTQSWTPLSNQIKGLVVLLHGLNEHSGRYNGFAKQLNANGYKVYGMDWIGHGGSDGLHGYVHSLDHAVNDLKAFLEKVLTENPGLPCFLFGHSTGAAIILKAVLDPKIETLISGVALTSPAIGVQPSHPIFGVLAPIFSFLLPKYQFSAANKNGTKVSRDPEALIAKYSDPLVFTGAIRIRTGSEILRISSYLQQNMNRLTVPFIVLHGTDDAVTNPEASKKLYEEAPSTDKSIKLYKGLLHDLLFEPEKEIITKDIIDWLNSRVKI